MRVSAMLKQRLLFKKTGLAKYLSHLDLMRTFQRAFLRADIRLRHTEGFNPHPVMSFALPLSVGSESICELLDFQLIGGVAPDDPVGRLNSAMPQGIEVLKVYKPLRKFSEIKWLKIKGRFEYDGGVPDGAAEALEEFFKSEKLIIKKKTKKGATDFDIVPCVKYINFENADINDVFLEAVISAQDPSLNPKYLVEAVRTHMAGASAQPGFAAFKRIDVLDKSGGIFR